MSRIPGSDRSGLRRRRAWRGGRSPVPSFLMGYVYARDVRYRPSNVLRCVFVITALIVGVDILSIYRAPTLIWCRADGVPLSISVNKGLLGIIQNRAVHVSPGWIFRWERISEMPILTAQKLFAFRDEIDHTILVMPFWVFIIACGTIIYFLWPRKIASGFCAKCGYDLRASSDRCPECGNAISTPSADAN